MALIAACKLGEPCRETCPDRNNVHDNPKSRQMHEVET